MRVWTYTRDATNRDWAINVSVDDYHERGFPKRWVAATEDEDDAQLIVDALNAAELRANALRLMIDVAAMESGKR